MDEQELLNEIEILELESESEINQSIEINKTEKIDQIDQTNKITKKSPIINEINIEEYKSLFEISKRVRISHFLEDHFAEALYKYSFLLKDWILATGIDKNKYEKKNTPENNKINQLQIKNVNEAFGKDQFSYIFYRAMNNDKKMSIYEFTLRKVLNAPEFINTLNEITNLKLTKLNTLFMSKYKSGNFLSTHSDKGNGRLAFVINLTKFWKPQYGGNLHFLNEERNEIIDTFVPEFNNLVLFYIPDGNGIPHYVSQVAQNVKHSRYAISGWFI
jgi:Rps23 Pro-64 3,4-dihydroxylase Tpa1-like proline 4-hydroxylase